MAHIERPTDSEQRDDEMDESRSPWDSRMRDQENATDETAMIGVLYRGNGSAGDNLGEPYTREMPICALAESTPAYTVKRDILRGVI